MIIIRKNVISPPLLQSKDANIVEFYDDKFGDMTGILHQVIPGRWSLTLCTDKDWEATLIRLGYKTVNTSAAQFIKSIGD